MATVQPADGGFRRAADAMTGSREVARGLLFDDNDRILLVHWRDPVTGHEFLEPPGGLREPRESGEDAVRREIAEEAGIAGLEVEGFVTQIDHRFTFAGKEYDCREHYFACRLTHPANSTRSLDQVEQAGIVGVEWVSLKELASYPSTYLEPPELLHMLKRLGPTIESQRWLTRSWIQARSLLLGLETEAIAGIPRRRHEPVPRLRERLHMPISRVAAHVVRHCHTVLEMSGQSCEPALSPGVADRAS